MFFFKGRIHKVILSFILFLSLLISSTTHSCATDNANSVSRSSAGSYDLSSFSNWDKGFYTNDGTKSSSSSIRVKDYLSVDPSKTYLISISDERFSINICEYTSDKNFICKYAYYNNAEFKPSKETRYTGIFLSAPSASYESFQKKFASGLTINISPIKNYDPSLTSVNFTNTSLYKSGKYIKKITEERSYALCANSPNASLSLFDSYKTVSRDCNYVFNTPDDNIKLCIVEQSANGTALSQITLSSKDIYTPSLNTEGVAISFMAGNSDITVDKIYEYLKNGTLYISETTANNESNTVEPPSTPIETPAPEPVIIEPAPPVKTIINGDAHKFVNNMRAGWNLGNTLDAHTGEWNGQENLNYEFVFGNPKTTQEILQYVADQGFDTIRIPVSWCFHTYKDDQGHYHIYKSWLNRVKEIVDMSLNAGLKVIINSHHDYRLIYVGTDDASFSKVKNNAVDIWSNVADYFKDYDDRLLFESYNELQNVDDGYEYSTVSAAQTNELNQIFVDTVRRSGGKNAGRLLIIPTLMDKYGSPFMNSLILPKDSETDKLIIEIHMYSDEFDQSISSTFAELQKQSNRLGAPIIIGECGYKKSYALADRAKAMSNFVARAKDYGIKTIVWDNGVMNDYGIIDRRNLSESLTDMISAIVKPAKYDGNGYTDITKYLVPEVKLNQSTGEIVVDVWWGCMVASSKNLSRPLDTSAKYLKLKCINVGDAFGKNIHYVDFYDASGNAIKMCSKGYPGLDFYSYEIPEGARYVNICLFASKQKTTKDEFLQYIANGDLKLLMGYEY